MAASSRKMPNHSASSDMTFSFITLFPTLIESYFQESILKIAREKGLIAIDTIQLRDFARDSYKSVDAPQIGGGAGQVLLPCVLERAIQHTIAKPSQPPESKKALYYLPYTLRQAIYPARCNAPSPKRAYCLCVWGDTDDLMSVPLKLMLMMVFSVGDFIVTGGELAALCLCDSIARRSPKCWAIANPCRVKALKAFCLKHLSLRGRNDGVKDFTPI